MVPQGGFPTDLTELNLSGWAALVQDVVAGLQALPPRLSHDLGLQVVALLQLLEVATGVGFCHHCCNPRPHCKCMGASQVAPPTSWSQVVEQTPGYGLASSFGGLTTPSPSMRGMPGYVAPPPGLTPPDYSIWSMPPQEAPSPKGLPASPPYHPPIGRAAQMRATLDRQAQAPRALVLQAPVSQAPALQAPQMAPPLHQPLPSSRGWPATPYQQMVQPPGKSTGLGVTFDSSTNKPVATGGQDVNGHGRQRTRGRDDNTQPASHSRGMRERSSIRTTSKQTPCQVGEHPSGAPHNVPPASTPVSILPQHGGGERASPKDPLKNATNYKSAGWRKDLEHVLKIYYRHNVTSFKEVEWSKMKEKFFTHLLQRKEEWRDIKENLPIQYMPYMEDHFYTATGLRLNGLRDFTRWIKQGSYYHGLVARQGHLHKCPHLVGVALPRWPQTTPSESCQVSQKKVETPATSSSAPSTGAGEAQETHSNDVPAPMETGGVGDGRSWVEQVEASADDEFQRDRPAKHHQSQLRRREDRPTLPFPLQDNKGRCASAQQLYQHAGEQPQACHNVATLGITHLHLELLPHEARSLSNQVLCMIAEYHLTSSAQGSSSLSAVLSEAVRDLLPPVEDYIVGGTFQGMRDVRVVDRAKTLQIATWLHCLDMVAEGDGIASQTLEVKRHGRGPPRRV